MKAYFARGMTGRSKSDVVFQATLDERWTRYYFPEITVLCPVKTENVKNESGTVNASVKEMDVYWKRDKEMIREAHVVFDMTPHLKSEGVAHEIGYARYHLWKKVIRVYPYGQLPSKASVAFYEDDYVTDSLDDACQEALRTHGTWFKRFTWRLGIFKRCFLKSIWYRLGEWK